MSISPKSTYFPLQSFVSEGLSTAITENNIYRIKELLYQYKHLIDLNTIRYDNKLLFTFVQNIELLKWLFSIGMEMKYDDIGNLFCRCHPIVVKWMARNCKDIYLGIDFLNKCSYQYPLLYSPTARSKLLKDTLEEISLERKKIMKKILPMCTNLVNYILFFI
jgi:hypothetical protein